MDDISLDVIISKVQWRSPIPSDFFRVQTGINHKMRSIVVAWFIEVCIVSKFPTRTIFLSVALLDRFLSSNEVARHRLQLVAVTVIRIASKVCSGNVRFQLSLDDTTYLCDGAVTRKQCIEMEPVVLRALDFRLEHATPDDVMQSVVCLALDGEGEGDGKGENKVSFLLQQRAHFVLSLVLASPMMGFEIANNPIGFAIAAVHLILVVCPIQGRDSPWVDAMSLGDRFERKSVEEMSKRMHVEIAQLMDVFKYPFDEFEKRYKDTTLRPCLCQ